MNVFEDLIVELKEENLLESTVNEADQAKVADVDVVEEKLDVPESSSTKSSFDDKQEVEIEVVEETGDDITTESQAVQPEPSIKVKNGKEFFKKRAVAEVSSLQMVEHVLTGVEREYLKIVPKAFDDFNVKKTLNLFLQVVENENSSEYQEAEFKLMTETEAWCTALATRDSDIPVSSLRQFCENSSPALSSQALLALARFYRNLPFSESVRAKFDFVITRLFSRPTGWNQRSCLFTLDETLLHITNLYKDWSSLSLYNAEDDDSKVLLTALSFEDLAVEAENASNYEQLIESDFFARLRLFKESISELFFAPNVTASAIACNIRIGNAYVNLIDLERKQTDAESIQSKYGDLHDSAVSNAAARTLDLVEVLREQPKEAGASEDDKLHVEEAPTPGATAKQMPKSKAGEKKLSLIERLTENALSVNKWFLGVAIVLIAATLGLYVWANYFIEEEVTTAGVEKINIENSSIKEHIKTARVSGETFYGLLLPSWDTLPKEKRQEFLQKVYQACQEKGCTQVNLISKEGKMVGHASATRLEVVMP